MKKPKKKMNVGKELVQRTKNLNKNIETIMGKTAKPKLKKKIIKFLKNWDNNTPDGYEFSMWDYCKIMDMTITLLRECVADEYKVKSKTFLESMDNGQ